MKNILLIKLGALGDVLRTTCLLSGIQKKWPGAQITWITAQNAMPLLARNGRTEKVLAIESIGPGRTVLDETAWDVLINLDEDPRATTLAARLSAEQKYGVGRDGQGRLSALSPESEHLIQLSQDDRLKFRENQMPFQALVYRAIGLAWSGEPYVYTTPADIALRQSRFFSGVDPSRPKVGLFVGASERYANKFWAEPEIEQFCTIFHSTPEAIAGRSMPALFLFGGPAERSRLDRLGAGTCRTFNRIAVDTLDDMASLAAACRLIICGDTLVMHLGQALGIPQIVLFGPTAHAEIAVSGRKIVTPYSCGPCYLRACDITPSCMTAIRPERIFGAVQELLPA